MENTRVSKLLRLRQVLERLPVSKSSWYDGIRDGKYPAGLRIAPRTVAWPERVIDDLIERLEREAA